MQWVGESYRKRGFKLIEDTDKTVSLRPLNKIVSNLGSKAAVKSDPVI